MLQLKRSKNSTKRNAPPREVKLRKVVPLEPLNDRERAELVEDLTTIGCEGFYAKLQGFKNKAMVRELTEGAPNQFDNTLRPVPCRGSSRERQIQRTGLPWQVVST